MLTVTRKFEFDAGHRVLRHESKCRHLHGHRYVAELSVTAPGLDALGRIVDFGVLKTIVGSWIDEYWDHNILLHPEDPLLELIQTPIYWGGKDPFVMPIGQNPTAENMAKILFGQSCYLLRTNPELTVNSVRLYETPNCFADYNGKQ